MKTISSCQLAKKVFKVKKTICRFRDDVYFDQLSVFGEGVIDIPISPEDEITSHLKELIDHPGSNQIESFANGKVKLVSVKAKKKGKLVGRELKGIKDRPALLDLRCRSGASNRQHRQAFKLV